MIPDATTVLSGVAVVLLAAFIKGTVGFGFPPIATSLLALFIDVKTAIALLIVPNIVMDTIQMVRRGNLLATARRLAVLLVTGAVGTVIGTRLLVVLPAWVASLVLGAFTLAFVALNATRFTFRVAPERERPLAAVAGLAAGLVGGLTNTPGTTLVIFFYALGLPKHEFVRAVSLSFVVLKLVQLAAVAHYGLLSWGLLQVSLGLTAVALTAFWLGLKVQDRLDQRSFNRAVLTFLALLGLWLVVRSLA